MVRAGESVVLDLGGDKEDGMVFGLLGGGSSYRSLSPTLDLQYSKNISILINTASRLNTCHHYHSNLDPTLYNDHHNNNMIIAFA